MGKSRQTGKLSSDGMIFPSPSNGRVGIGTSVPSETLHIEGSARLTEELYDYNNIAGSSGQVLTSTGVGVSWSSEGVGGDEGAQGAQGTQATQGSQGFQGLQGLQGFQGTQGFQGNQGTQGLSNQGAQGSQGSQGTQGVKGDNGNFGGASFEYNFDSSETDADPGSGNIRLVRTSGADLTTSTQINIDDNSTNATDISSYLATIDASTSTIKGHLKITKIGDASAFIMYTISTESDQSGYHTITVSSVDNSGVNPFANGDQLLVTFARTGDKGDQGNQGDEGLQGNQGTQGVGSQGGQGLQGGGGQGTQGSQGFQGTQGTQGLSNQGAQGIQGIESGQVTAKEYDVAVSSGVFTIDTVSQPDLYLIRGQKYTFDQSDSTNYNHPLELTLTNGSGYTNGWSSDGNMPADASTSGTRVHTFIVPYDAPDEIFYICNVHGSGMGNSIYISDLTASDLQGLQGLQGGGGQGTQGSQGFQGTQGAQGAQGTQGLGNQGLQGVQGLGVQGAAGTGGGSSGIEIENNGTSVGTGIVSINFSTNVTATASGGIATVTASGGGGGGSTTRTVTTQTISSATDTYSVTYDVGYIDVYLNGVRLETGEYTATNGTSIVLNSNTHVGDVIEFVAYSSVNLSSINLSDDTDPELGGDLDLSGHDIGNISITGSISANSSTVATQSDAIAFAIALG